MQLVDGVMIPVDSVSHSPWIWNPVRLVIEENTTIICEMPGLLTAEYWLEQIFVLRYVTDHFVFY